MGKKVDGAVLGKRIGHSSESNISKVQTNINAEGLVLSQVVYKPIESLKPNPYNTVFNSLKTKQQFEALYKDIDEARAILNPLIALPDGTLIEGEGRLDIAKKLEEEGKGLGPLPVRIITTPLTNEEIKQRVYLGNLSRFEIDADTRISLYSEIWPDYFYYTGKAGRKTDHGDTITASMLSEKLGKSIPQIKRDAAIYRNARKKIGGCPSVADIKESRKELNEERKQRTKKKNDKNITHPVVSSLVDYESRLLMELSVEGEWDFSIGVDRFTEYARLLSSHDMYARRIIVEYLIERIIVLEKANEKPDSLGRSDS